MTTLPDLWPALPYDDIAPTAEHLHRLVQIGSKYTLDLPFAPNWGNITLTMTPRGFVTPVLWSGDVTFQVHYDILDDHIVVNASTGTVTLSIAAGTVAHAYKAFVDGVAELRIPAPRNTLEPEIAGAPHFDTDTEVRPYDGVAARHIWAAFTSAARALDAWQAPYRGPRTSVGIMWGGFDVYAPRYSGKSVTPPSDKPTFQQNGMMSEVVAVGFSLGDEQTRAPAFFAYISPPPDGIASADFAVPAASYNAKAGLISLPWEAVRASDDPQGTIVTFADAIYEVAVKLGGWPADWVGARVDGWYASKHPM